MSQTTETSLPSIVTVPRTLGKGESHVYTAIVAFLCGLLIAAFVFWAFKVGFGNRVTQVSFVLVLVKGSSLLAGVLASLTVWHLSELPTVPIGHKGVPTFFGGRSQAFLFPEGKNRSFIPLLLNLQPVDVRTALLSNVPGEEYIKISALASSTPVALTSAQGEAASKLTGRAAYMVPVTLIISVPRRVIHPYLHLGFEDPDSRNINKIVAAMRKYVVDKEVLDLPSLKADLTEHLRSVAAIFYETGAEPGNVEVMDVEIPHSITDAALRIPIEEIQRVTEMRQSETLAAATAILRKYYTNLSDQELRNMVLAAADLAKMTISTVEGGRGTSTLNLVGDTGEHHGH